MLLLLKASCLKSAAEVFPDGGDAVLARSRVTCSRYLASLNPDVEQTGTARRV